MPYTPFPGWKPELTWMALEGAVDNFGEYMMQQALDFAMGPTI